MGKSIHFNGILEPIGGYKRSVEVILTVKSALNINVNANKCKNKNAVIEVNRSTRVLGRSAIEEYQSISLPRNVGG